MVYRPRASGRVYAFGAAWMGVIVMPVYVPFLTSRGLAVGDVLGLQAVYAMAVMLFEIPTGYVCDVVGRQRAILIGAALNLIGLTAFATVRGFPAYAAVQLVLAAGLSLVSGADIALIYEILDMENADRPARAQAIGRYVFAQTVGEAVLGLLGGALAVWSLTAVGWATAAEAALPLLIAATLRRAQGDQPRARLADVLPATRQLFRQPGLGLLFINMVVWSLSTFIAVWLLQPYWRERASWRPWPIKLTMPPRALRAKAGCARAAGGASAIPGCSPSSSPEIGWSLPGPRSASQPPALAEGSEIGARRSVPPPVAMLFLAAPPYSLMSIRGTAMLRTGQCGPPLEASGETPCS